MQCIVLDNDNAVWPARQQESFSPVITLGDHRPVCSKVLTELPLRGAWRGPSKRAVERWGPAVQFFPRLPARSAPRGECQVLLRAQLSIVLDSSLSAHLTFHVWSSGFFSSSYKIYLDSLTSAAASAPARVAVLPRLFVQQPVPQVHVGPLSSSGHFPAQKPEWLCGAQPDPLSPPSHARCPLLHRERVMVSQVRASRTLWGQEPFPPTVFINQCCCKNK